jgi:5'-nucleotidase
MRILISNDDGIRGEGLIALETIARALSDDVTVVAPETDQSGVAHSLSLSRPLRLREISSKHFAVDGTPTDCVLMAVNHVFGGKKPDLVLSGVNHGQNIAEDITYSGTVAVAIEATLLGIPAIALSQAFGGHTREKPRFDTAVKHAPDIIRRVLKLGIAGDTLINLNFPNCAPDEVEGTSVTVQGRRPGAFIGVDKRLDHRGNDYFWLAYGAAPFEPHEGTDLWAMRHRRISISALKIDLTDLPTTTRIAAEFGG